VTITSGRCARRILLFEHLEGVFFGFLDISMDHHQHSLSGESSSSAIDLTGTTAGLGSSVPSSPALIPADSRGSFARRRLSRGRIETTEDPLRFDPVNPHPRTTSPQRTVTQPGWSMHEDPFFSPTDEDAPSFTHNYGYRSANGGTYITSQPGPSSASLISTNYRTSDPDIQREDDEAHLTSNMSRIGTGNDWEEGENIDPEHSSATARRRRTLRYSGTPSPLRKTGNRLMTISRNLRRASLRVVNMAGAGIDEHIRLADVDDEKYVGDENEYEDGKFYDALELEDLSKVIPIRGRTLGFMGPKSRIRLALFRFLVYR
jgi:voltage-dependent calcium channel